jgi:uncharacterized spore protein YtfJ
MSCMGIEDVIQQTREELTVKRVFGDPYEKDGTTVIPAAAVLGGAGGGAGQDREGQRGSGSGFGLMARPVGAFIIRNGDVTWRPAYDATLVALVGEIVVLTAVLAVRAVVRARSKARKRASRGSG